MSGLAEVLSSKAVIDKASCFQATIEDTSGMCNDPQHADIYV